jgi:dienelactone hydrolase
MTAEEVRIEVPAGGELAATYQAPDGASACVVMGHGFGLPRQAGTGELAAALAEAGIATLRFDNRHINEGSGAEPRQLISAPVQREDWRAALSWARSRPGIERIGAWGYSFGGARLIEMTAEGNGIAAAATRCPNSNVFVTMASIGLSRFGKIGALGVRDQLAALRRRPPVTAPIADRDHPAAIFHGDQAERYLAAVPDGTHFENAFLTRVLLQTAHLWAGRLGRKIKVPMLVVAGTSDEVTPPKPAQRFANKAGAEFLTYDGDHFTTFLDPEVGKKIVAAEAAFLTRELAA